MAIVIVPDGRKVRFPDDMSPDQIKAVIAEKFPEQVAQQRYDTALGKVRQSQFGGMDDAQWAEYSSKAFAPSLEAQGQQSTTLGFGDELSAAMGGLGAQLRQWTGGGGGGYGEAYGDIYELEQARLELARQRNGSLGTAVEVAGGLGAAAPAKGAQMVAAGLHAAKTTAATRTGQFAQMALPAAAGGAVYGSGATDGDLSERAVGAGLGAAGGVVASAAAPLVGKVIEGTVRRVAQVPANRAVARAQRQAIQSAPTAATIKAGSKAAYNAAEATGATVSRDAMNILRHDVRQILDGEGMMLSNGRLNIDDYPKVRAAVALLDDLAEGPVTIRQAQTLTKRIRKAQASTDPDEARIGMTLANSLDDFLDGLPDQAFVRGNGQEAVQQWAKGRNEWARYRRTATIETALERAQLASGGLAAGLRNEFRSILKSPKKQRGFAPADLTAMRKFVQGGKMEDVLGFFANGGTLPASLSGYAMGGPVGAVATAAGKLAAGAAAKAGLNRGARQTAETLRASVATPGGLPQRPALPAPTQQPLLPAFGGLVANPLFDEPRDFIARSIAR